MLWNMESSFAHYVHCLNVVTALVTMCPLRFVPKRHSDSRVMPRWYTWHQVTNQRPVLCCSLDIDQSQLSILLRRTPRGHHLDLMPSREEETSPAAEAAAGADQTLLVVLFKSMLI